MKTIAKLQNKTTNLSVTVTEDERGTYCVKSGPINSSVSCYDHEPAAYLSLRDALMAACDLVEGAG